MGTYAVTPQGLYAARLVRMYFPSSLWATMVAIADQESVFNCHITNGSYIGLFQIGPSWYSYGGGASGLLNCQTNAKVAAIVLQKQGLGAWQSYTSGAYKAFLPLAQTLINHTAPVSTPRSQTAPVLTISPSFGASGSASVTSGGRISGTLRLTISHGTVNYKVTMGVTPSYNTSDPTSTTTSGSATNTTVNVNQSLIAPLPSPEIIRSYQQIHSGPVVFHYTVNWTVTDQTGASKTVSAGKVVTLTVQ